MNRNQKIGIGCGAAGCLGLIVIGIAGGLLFYFRSQSSPSRYRASRNFNFNTILNSNQNSNSTNSDASETSDTSSYSDDDKHKLFTAATFSQDSDLIRKTLIKIGLLRADGTPGPTYEEFVKEHVGWTLQNMEFVNTVNSPEKGRAYVESHLQD